MLGAGERRGARAEVRQSVFENRGERKNPSNLWGAVSVFQHTRSRPLAVLESIPAA